jgi:predicted nucleic acid-binding protein
MTYFFFDTSALVKRYIPEQGTARIKALTVAGTGNTILVARITEIELVSAVMRRKRDGQISPGTARALKLLLNRHINREYKVIGLTLSVVQKAANLLRAYDVVQLASALESNNRLVSVGLSPLVFVSADQRLLTAAVNEKLTVDDPNSHP